MEVVENEVQGLDKKLAYDEAYLCIYIYMYEWIDAAIIIQKSRIFSLVFMCVRVSRRAIVEEEFPCLV